MQLQSSLHPQFSTFQEFFYWFCTNTKLWKLVRFRENQISVDFQHFHQFYIPLDKKDTARGIGKVPIFVAFIDENVRWSGRGLCGIYHWIASEHLSSASLLHPASEPRHAWGSSTEIAASGHFTINNPQSSPMQRRWLHSQCNAHNPIIQPPQPTTSNKPQHGDWLGDIIYAWQF